MKELQNLAETFGLEIVSDFRGGYKLVHGLKPHPKIRTMLPVFIVRKDGGGSITNVDTPAEVVVFAYGNRNQDYPSNLNYQFASVKDAAIAVGSQAFIASAIWELVEIVDPNDAEEMIDEYSSHSPAVEAKRSDLDLTMHELASIVFQMFGAKLRS